MTPTLGRHGDRHAGDGDLPVHHRAHGAEPTVPQQRVLQPRLAPRRRDDPLAVRAKTWSAARRSTPCAAARVLCAARSASPTAAARRPTIDLSYAQIDRRRARRDQQQHHDQRHGRGPRRPHPPDRQTGQNDEQPESPGSRQRHDGRLAGTGRHQRRRRRGRRPGRDLRWAATRRSTRSTTVAACSINTALPDIEYTLRDGTTGPIDFSPIISGSSTVEQGDHWRDARRDQRGRARQAQGRDRRRRQTADDHRSDHRAAGASRSRRSTNRRPCTTWASTARRRRRDRPGGALLGGLQDRAARPSLDGGKGLGTLGSCSSPIAAAPRPPSISRDAETLEDVIETINAAGVGITAQVNDARNGIELADTTGLSSRAT